MGRTDPQRFNGGKRLKRTILKNPKRLQKNMQRGSQLLARISDVGQQVDPQN